MARAGCSGLLCLLSNTAGTVQERTQLEKGKALSTIGSSGPGMPSRGKSLGHQKLSSLSELSFRDPIVNQITEINSLLQTVKSH